MRKLLTVQSITVDWMFGSSLPPRLFYSARTMPHNFSNQMTTGTAVRGYEVVLGISRAFQHAPLSTQFLTEPVETHVPKSILGAKNIYLWNAAIRFRQLKNWKKKKDGTTKGRAHHMWSRNYHTHELKYLDRDLGKDFGKNRVDTGNLSAAEPAWGMEDSLSPVTRRLRKSFLFCYTPLWHIYHTHQHARPHSWATPLGFHPAFQGPLWSQPNHHSLTSSPAFKYRSFQACFRSSSQGSSSRDTKHQGNLNTTNWMLCFKWPSKELVAWTVVIAISSDKLPSDLQIE